MTDLEWCFLGAKESLYQVADLAKRVKDIPGDLVELGIASGSGIAAMKRACPDKMVWGYDSFKGIQLCGPNDDQQPGMSFIHHDREKDNLLVSSGVTVCPRDWVDACLKGWGFKEGDFTLVEGWVQETLPIITPKKIALLRLDMDIYDPTLVALEYLWPKLSKGGILLIDDGNLAGVNRAVDTYFRKIGYTPTWVRDHTNPYYCVK